MNQIRYSLGSYMHLSSKACRLHDWNDRCGGRSRTATTISPPAAGNRVDGIDVLRGISILLVVLHHIHLRFKLNNFAVTDLLPEPVMQVLFWSGYDGVIVFFVISGFLITRLSLLRWGSLATPQIRQFYLLRIARIVPCLLLLLAILSVLHAMDVTGFVIKPERATLMRALFAALTLHINWLEGQQGYLPGCWDVLWSLSVEESFYILFPLVCLCMRSERGLLMLLLALIGFAPLYRTGIADQEPWNEYAYLACVDGIAFGCIAALIAARCRIERRPLQAILVIGCAIFALSLMFRRQGMLQDLHSVGVDLTLLQLGVAMMLVAFGNGVGASLSIATVALRFIGRCSYEMYLSHMFVVLGLMNLIKGSQQTTTTLFLWYAAMLLLSIALGHAVFRIYSEPVNRALRRKFLDSHSQPQVAATDADAA